MLVPPGDDEGQRRASQCSSTGRPSGPRCVTPIDSSVNVPSSVKAATHPSRSLTSATLYARRTICSLSSVTLFPKTMRSNRLGLAARQVIDRHWVPVIRQTGTTDDGQENS